MNVVNSYVGQPIERIEDLRLLRGRGQFVDDLHLDGMLHAAVLRSSIPHGRIIRLDTTAARVLPGVAAVITAAEIGDPVPTIPLRLVPMSDLVPYEQPVIANGKVRYVGEPIAVVVAESAAIAEDALELIAVEIETLPPCVDTRTAAANQSLLFEETGTNLALTYTAVLGDADAAFAAATTDEYYIRRERFDTQRHTATTMETRGLIGAWDSEKQHLTVYGAARCRSPRAACWPSRSACRIRHRPDRGRCRRRLRHARRVLPGGFPDSVRRPSTRSPSEMDRGSPRKSDRLESRPRIRMRAGIALRRDGAILALRGRGTVDLGAYIRSNAITAARNNGAGAVRPVPRVQHPYRERAAGHQQDPTGTYRGPGRFEADFFRERLFDMAANDLGIDRVEFRRKNLIAESEMPWELPDVQPLEQQERTRQWRLPPDARPLSC